MSKNMNVQVLHVTKTTAEWASETSVIKKGLLCIEFTSNGGTKAKIGDGNNSYSNLPYLQDGSFTISSYYTKEETDGIVSDAIRALGNIITIKGVVGSAGSLPTTNNNVGDLYFVGTQGSTTDSFSEYVWTTNSKWEYLGTVQTEVDLSGYATIDYVTSNTHTHSNKAVLDATTSSFTTTKNTNLTTAYNHSQVTSGNPHNVTKSDVGLGNVENKSSATIRGELTKTDVTDALGYTPPTTDTKYTHPTYTARTGVPTANSTPSFGGTFSISQVTSDATGHVTGMTTRTVKIPNTTATTSSSGLMSSTDKKNLTDAISDIESLMPSINYSTTLYVNATSGVDTNNGKSSSTAFKTIEKAIDEAIKYRTCIIMISAGSYDVTGNDTSVIDIRGSVALSIRGNDVSDTIINGRFSIGRGAFVSLQNLTINSTTSTTSDGGIFAWENSRVICNPINITVSAGYCVQASTTSEVYLSGGTLSGTPTNALKVQSGAMITGHSVTNSTGKTSTSNNTGKLKLNSCTNMTYANSTNGEVWVDGEQVLPHAYSVSTHAHGLSDATMSKQFDSATDSWETIGIENSGFILKSLRSQTNAPPWFLGSYSAGIAFGGHDTRGVISHSYASPHIRFAGGDNSTRWWIGVKGTTGSTYDLSKFLTSSGTIANATTATKLSNTTAVGSATNPVYFNENGVPVKTTYTLGASVPSGAKFTDTWTALKGATASANGTAGYAPAPPSSGYNTKYLRADGTWTVPPNTTYSNFVKSGSGAAAGLVPAPSTTAGTTKYLREDGTWTVPPDTTYTHPTTAGNKHIPSGGASGQILRWSASGTAVWGDDKDTVYTHPSYTARTGVPTANATPAFGEAFNVSQVTSDETGHVTGMTTRKVTIPATTMTAATASAAGTKGLVPAPAAGKQTSFLRGDGTWVVPTNTDTKVTQNATASAKYRPIVMGYTESTDTTTLNTALTDTVYVNNTIYAQPSTGTLHATAFSGSGANLTTLNASNISSGTLGSDRLPTVPVSKGGTGATNAYSARFNLNTHPFKVVGNNTSSDLTSGGWYKVFSIGESDTATTYRSFVVTLLVTTYNSVNNLIEPTLLQVRLQSNAAGGAKSTPVVYVLSNTESADMMSKLYVVQNSSTDTGGFEVWFNTLEAYDAIRISVVDVSSRRLGQTNDGFDLLTWNDTPTTPESTAITSTMTDSYSFDTIITHKAKVTQSQSSVSTFRPILLGYNTDSDYTKLSTPVTAQALMNYQIYAQPSSGSLYATQFKLAGTWRGLWLDDVDGTSYPAIYNNTGNLWIGGSSSNGQYHHHGQVYISSGYSNDDKTEGYESIWISVPSATVAEDGTRTVTGANYKVIHSGGGTIDKGTLKLSSAGFREALTIYRTSNNFASIAFENTSGVLGSIGMNAVDGSLVRHNSGTTAYTVLDTGNYTTTLDGRYVNVSGDTMTDDLTISKSSLNTLTVKSTSGDVHVDLDRGTRSSWRIANVSGNLKIQNNYTTTAGDYFDLFSMSYNTGNATFVGSVTAPTFNGTATKVQSTVLSNTAETSYALAMHSGATTGSKSLVSSTVVRANSYVGTTTANGRGILILGNVTESGTAGNGYGTVRLYGAGQYYGNLQPNVSSADLTAARNWYLPNASGTIALLGDAEKVKQTKSGSAKYRSLLLGYTEGDTPAEAGAGGVTNISYVTPNLYCTPSTGIMYANRYVSNTQELIYAMANSSSIYGATTIEVEGLFTKYSSVLVQADGFTLGNNTGTAQMVVPLKYVKSLGVYSSENTLRLGIGPTDGDDIGFQFGYIDDNKMYMSYGCSYETQPSNSNASGQIKIYAL